MPIPRSRDREAVRRVRGRVRTSRGIVPGVRGRVRRVRHDAEGRPVNASGRQRHPATRQKRVAKERDRVCVDCSRADLLEYDHNPAFETTGRTVVDELELGCAPCHQRRHQLAEAHQTTARA